MKKLVSLLLAVMMLLTFALAENEAAPLAENVAVVVNGEEILTDMVKQYAEFQVSMGYAETADYAGAVEDLIINAVANQKIKELSLDQFTQEEKDAFMLDVQAQWQQAIDEYVSYYLTEDTEEARKQAEIDGAAYYEAMGYNQDALLENMLNSESFNKLEAYMMKDVDTTVTEEEIQKTFIEAAEQDKANFEGNVYMYELYQQYYGYVSWYQPEGYRGVTHILLKPDEELLTKYQELVASAEEEGTTVTQADVDAAYQAVIADCQETIDTIYSRLEQGESFETLIAEFGTDPGMNNPVNLKDGYAVHKDSTGYDMAFTAGSFSDKMQKVGDVSDPVVSSFGVHIMYYLRDIPAGYVEMTDAIRAEIEEYLTTAKQNAGVNAMMTSWVQESEIVYNTEAINTLSVAEEAAEVPAE